MVSVLIASCLVDCFCRLSGLRLNTSKSVLTGINVDQGALEQMAAALVYGVKTWPITYLELPLVVDPLKEF